MKPIVPRIAAILAAAGLLAGIAASAEAQTVRDHRGETRKLGTPRPGSGQPVIRDHRDPLTLCVGFPSPSCQNLRPKWTPQPR